MKTAIWTDPIVEETRKWREELLNESGNDLGRLVQHLMESQVRHGERLICFEPGKVPASELSHEDKGDT